MRSFSPSQYISLAAVLAVTTAGGYLGYQRFAPKPVVAARIATADVTQGAIAASVTATGSVASPMTSKLSFRSSGKLTALLVAVGDQVTEGQPLARIDDIDLQMALLEARASYSSAAAKLEQAKAGATAEEIRAAETSVAQARIKLNQVQGVTQGPEMAAAQGQLQSAKLKLEQLLAGPRPEDLAAALAQVDSANAKLQALTNPRQEDVTSAQASLESARLKLAQLQYPRQEDVRNAEASLATANIKLQALTNPRPEDLAAAQGALDQQKTKTAQLLDSPANRPEDIANAELSVRNAEIALDKARADAGTAGKSGSSTTQASADASVQQALISLQRAQNDLSKLKQQGPTDWEIRLQQQALDQAQISLDKLLKPSPSDIASAQQSVIQAQSTLDKLVKPSDSDVQAAQLSVTQAQASLDKLLKPSDTDILGAQQSLISAQASLEKLIHPTDYDIQVARDSVNQAQISIDKLLNGNSYDVQTNQLSLASAQATLDLKKAGPTAQDLAIAVASFDQATLALKRAEANLAGVTLSAPYAGTVSALVGNIGEQTAAGVVTLVDTRQLRVDVVVDETDVAKVQPGQQVALTFEALQGQRVPGQVSVIAPLATVQQGVVSYQVQIKVDPGQAAGIRPGMTSTATITTARKDGALLVPNRAVKTQGRNRIVDVQELDGKTATRQVQTGMANDQFTEVISGLNLGEKVIIPTTSTAQARLGGLGGPGGGAPGGFGGPPPGAVVVQR